MMSIIEVAFIRFYISLFFIKNLPFPMDTQLLLLFRRRPPWLKRKLYHQTKSGATSPSTLHDTPCWTRSNKWGSGVWWQTGYAWLCWDGYAGCAVHTKGKQDTLLQYYSITVLQCVLSCAVTTPTGALWVANYNLHIIASVFSRIAFIEVKLSYVSCKVSSQLSKLVRFSSSNAEIAAVDYLKNQGYPATFLFKIPVRRSNYFRHWISKAWEKLKMSA